ncbi:hypothetical protein HU200_034667 [Digitaria exilis]|uniref:Uncharacterized protein n=1 Tax=Digitaria exilis TaxID=1010633 RepID=A0A835EME9_9POAL|nr:hypothetical protein HU200_034667 [Digitaria exilis]
MLKKPLNTYSLTVLLVRHVGYTWAFSGIVRCLLWI